MAGPFDPYHKWLGIPSWEQPANHYRLLGLTLFESDADVIETAGDQRMAHLRTFQVGAHAADCQKLLNELAAARLCLLTPERKSAYDDELMRRQKSALVSDTTKWPTVQPATASREGIPLAPAARRRHPRYFIRDSDDDTPKSTFGPAIWAMAFAIGFILLVAYGRHLEPHIRRLWPNQPIAEDAAAGSAQRSPATASDHAESVDRANAEATPPSFFTDRREAEGVSPRECGASPSSEAADTAAETENVPDFFAADEPADQSAGPSPPSASDDFFSDDQEMPANQDDFFKNDE